MSTLFQVDVYREDLWLYSMLSSSASIADT